MFPEYGSGLRAITLRSQIRRFQRGQPVHPLSSRIDPRVRAAAAPKRRLGMRPAARRREVMTPAAAPPPARRPASPQRPGCADLLLQLRYPLTFESDEYPDEIDVTTASLDDPEAMPPRDQTHTKTRLRWVRLADGLPTYPDRHRDS